MSQHKGQSRVCTCVRAVTAPVAAPKAHRDLFLLKQLGEMGYVCTFPANILSMPLANSLFNQVPASTSTLHTGKMKLSFDMILLVSVITVIAISPHVIPDWKIGQSQTQEAVNLRACLDYNY